MVLLASKALIRPVTRSAARPGVVSVVDQAAVPLVVRPTPTENAASTASSRTKMIVLTPEPPRASSLVKVGLDCLPGHGILLNLIW